MPKSNILIAGSGHAGYQAAATLRQEDHDGRVIMVGAEDQLPYQRPPLSKAYLAGNVEVDLVALRPEAFYEKHDIELISADRVEEIDRQSQKVTLASGSVLPYDHLVLAVGARHRSLPLDTGQLDGILPLRTLQDSTELRRRLAESPRVIVVGAGFIGLEFATIATQRGCDVTVIEIQQAAMPRVISPTTAEFFAHQHTERGVRMCFATSITKIFGHEGKVVGVETSNGDRIDADLVLVGIGVIPNTDLAERAGLETANGIVVDEYLTTSDEAISAIGDCAMYPSPYSTGMVRLESVQNATDQGKFVASHLLGRPGHYASVPWFWSDQAGHRLQIAGITTGYDTTVVQGNPEEARFSVFCFRDGRLLGVESVNRAADHIAARRLLGQHSNNLTMGDVASEGSDLKAYVAMAAARPKLDAVPGKEL